MGFDQRTRIGLISLIFLLTGACAGHDDWPDKIPPDKVPADKIRVDKIRAVTPDASALHHPIFLPVHFSDLPGWKDDDFDTALAAFRLSCRNATKPVNDKQPALSSDLCKRAMQQTAARHFFESAFQPHRVTRHNDDRVLFTGYYEPLLHGSLTPDHRFNVPLYRFSKDASSLSRRQIEQGALSGKKQELIWVDDPIAAFFLSIQGSGKIRMPDGRLRRLGYAGRNRHPYVSIGSILVRDHGWKIDDVSLFSIRRWLYRDKERGQRLMWRNPAYIFFRLLDGPSKSHGPGSGPLGALSVALSPKRSIAVDPQYIPLGLPLWVVVEGDSPRLMIAQDTGSAIKGILRGDIFQGSGNKAEKEAGTLRAYGQYYILLPRSRDGTRFDHAEDEKPR